MQSKDRTGKHGAGFVSKLKPPTFGKALVKSHVIESLNVAGAPLVRQYLPGALRRRSKSSSDMRAAGPFQKLEPLPVIHAKKPLVIHSNVQQVNGADACHSKAPLKSATNVDVTNLRGVRPGLRRRSKSVVDLKLMRRPIITQSGGNSTDKSSGTSSAKSAAKVAPISVKNAIKNNAGIKRTMPDKTDEPKPKIMRTARIPPYDYKARFHHLEGIHRKLKSDHETLETNFTTCKDEQNAFITQRQQTKDQFARLEDASLRAETKIAALEATNTDKQKANDNFAKEVHELNGVVIDLTSQLTSKEASLKNFQRDHQRLNKAYKISRVEIVALKETNRNVNAENDNRNLQNEQLRLEIAELKVEVERKDLVRQKLHNDIQDLKGNIRVFCRVRPQLSNEDKTIAIIKCTDETELEIRRLTDSVSAITGRSAEVKQEFSFDRVFDENSTQADIFYDLSQLVQSALDGYNVCVFAYGQTGSGKTYTMQGFDAEHEGMIPRSLRVIFNYETTKKHLGWSFIIQASFLEIYNETVKDLLNIKNKEHLEIFYNDGKGVSVKNLTVQTVNTYAELRKLMAAAHKNRTVAATDFNLHSSRSHAVTQIHITGINETTKSKVTSMLNLVDLAGSESAKTSSQERLTETKSINKSLSTLGTVINDLSAGKTHIPYRNSKLTFLLQSCLGGNAKTLMIVHIAPNDECFGESISSLRFAAKVKSVKINSKKNRTMA